MRKQIVLAILLLSVSLFSFNEKGKTPGSLKNTKHTSKFCGPSFDSLYNQHSTALVNDVTVHDPLSNTFSLGFAAEPGDVFSISDAGSQCGYAGGIYHFWISFYNPAAGSIVILDQLNNVVACRNTSSSNSLYHMSFTAQCATTYRIVISNFSC